MRFPGSLVAAFCIGGLMIATARVSAAQQTPSGVPRPNTDYAEPDPPKPPDLPATSFVMPDLPDQWNHYTTYDGRRFSVRFSTVVILDYNAFSQDDESVQQVGEQTNQWDLRTWRLMTHGRLKFVHPVDYFVSLEVKGKDHVVSGDSKIGFTDLEISTEAWKLGTLHYGKIKEPMVYEMVGDAANLQQQERALSPFFVSRGIGLRLGRPFAHDAMTYTVGWFNDWYVQGQRFGESGNDFVGRLTAVPYLRNDGSDYFHVGGAVRYIGADAGTLRFRGRPESNVTSYYVDSGSIAGRHANEANVESLWNRGPFLMSVDVTRTWVDAPDSGNPAFWGGYLAASYVLTGEHRPYDKTVGYARRIMPRRKWGAWEVVGRYSHVDVAARKIDGGVFDRETIGLNWWATRRWRLSIDYGYIALDRTGVSGATNAIHTRLQWVY
jgi:phosphate-selective porin OprO and OprP